MVLGGCGPAEEGRESDLSCFSRDAIWCSTHSFSAGHTRSVFDTIGSACSTHSLSLLDTLVQCWTHTRTHSFSDGHTISKLFQKVDYKFLDRSQLAPRFPLWRSRGTLRRAGAGHTPGLTRQVLDTPLHQCWTHHYEHLSSIGYTTTNLF